jgi:uncharacterized protein with GYD domain
MAKYMVHGTYTPEGILGLIKDKASGRRDAIKALVKAAGGKLESIHYTLSADEVVLLVDLPDNVAGARISAMVGASGYATLSITPLLTVEEMDKALTKGLKYRAPGEE